MGFIKKLLLVVGLALYGIPELALANEEEDFDQTLYTKVKQHLNNYETKFNVEYKGNTKDIERHLQAIMEKVREEDTYVYENITKWKATYTYTKNKAKIEFTIDYLTTAMQENYVTKEIKRIAKDIVTLGMTNIEKVKAVHDYVILNTKYSTETIASQYTTYSLLTEGKAVCQGYALFMYRMLQELGIEVKYVKGHAGGELHGWNLVKLNEHWFHLDATWNDPMPDSNDQVRYKYFLLSDKDIAKTHTWDQTAYPSATSEKYDAIHVKDNAKTSGNKLNFILLTTDSVYRMHLKTLHLQKYRTILYERISEHKLSTL